MAGFTNSLNVLISYDCHEIIRSSDAPNYRRLVLNLCDAISRMCFIVFGDFFMNAERYILVGMCIYNMDNILPT